MIVLRNLMRARLRSAMTIAGIASGVALAMSIGTVTADLQAQIDGAAGHYRQDVVVLERRANSPMSSRIAAAQMESLVAEFGDDLTPLSIGTFNESWNPYALVIGAEARFARRVPLVQGEPYAAGQPELLAGEIAAQRLALSPGGTLSIGGQAFRVTGVYRSGSRLFDSGMLGDIALVRRMLSRGGELGHYSIAALHVAGGRAPEDVIRHIDARYQTLRAVASAELSGSLRLIRIVRAFVGTITWIAVAGAGAVLVNTLLMSVTERTREIGILMTIGWTPGRVLRLLLGESLVLCALGVLLGDAMAVGILRMVNRMPSVGFGWMPEQLAASQVALSLAGACALSLLALAWPAYVVWRMQPWAALRHE